VLALVAKQLADGMDRVMQLAKARDDIEYPGLDRAFENTDTFAYHDIAVHVTG
jgi:hypothetical protein